MAEGGWGAPDLEGGKAAARPPRWEEVAAGWVVRKKRRRGEGCQNWKGKVV